MRHEVSVRERGPNDLARSQLLLLPRVLLGASQRSRCGASDWLLDQLRPRKGRLHVLTFTALWFPRSLLDLSNCARDNAVFVRALCLVSTLLNSPRPQMRSRSCCRITSRPRWKLALPSQCLRPSLALPSKMDSTGRCGVGARACSHLLAAVTRSCGECAM